MIFDGYLKLYKETEDDDQISPHIKLNDQDLKTNKVAWSKINFKETYGSAPNRFNEPSLVKKLENLGIGRPSTYSAIISKIQEHKYIKIGNIQGIEKNIMTYTLTYQKNEPAKFEKKSSIQKIGNEKLRLIPTSDGELVTNYLIQNFPQIMDYKFTAHMEKLLDDIAEGNKIWYEVLAEFYDILKCQFRNIGIDIDSNQKNRVSKNDIIIGTHPKYGNIQFIETRYGPAFKVNLGGKQKKDLFVSAGKFKPTDDNVLESAIKYIDYKLKKSTK